jgi:hypothetical protein
LPNHFRLPHSALKRRQNLPLDVTVPGSQHRVMTNETNNQLSLTRTASLNRRGAKSKFLSMTGSPAARWRSSSVVARWSSRCGSIRPGCRRAPLRGLSLKVLPHCVITITF